MGSIDSESRLCFEPSMEVRMMQDQLDAFIEDEVAPLEREHDDLLGEQKELARVDENNRYKEEFLSIRDRIQEKAVKAGLYAMHMPKDVGGEGLSALEYTQMLEHLYNRHPDGFHDLILDTVSVSPSIIPMHEDEFLREQYLEPVLNAEKHMAFGLTEPDHGSDPQYMDTTAEKDGDEWVIDGTKCFISNSPEADFMLVFARTSGEPGSVDGISAFVVNSENPGWELGKVQVPMGTKLGEHGLNYFSNCRVPDRQMFGDEGEGFLKAMDWVGGARLWVPAVGVGRSQWMFGRCVEYANERETWGEPIATKQHVQDHLVQMRIGIEEVRWLYRYCAWKMDRGEDHRWLQSAAKLRGAQLWCDVADRAMQVHGGAGYWRSLPFEAEYRDARSARIYEGTDEIQKRSIAKQFLDL